MKWKKILEIEGWGVGGGIHFNLNYVNTEIFTFGEIYRNKIIQY